MSGFSWHGYKLWLSHGETRFPASELSVKFPLTQGCAVQVILLCASSVLPYAPALKRRADIPSIAQNRVYVLVSGFEAPLSISTL